jgi:hypothetical protein
MLVQVCIDASAFVEDKRYILYTFVRRPHRLWQNPSVFTVVQNSWKRGKRYCIILLIHCILPDVTAWPGVHYYTTLGTVVSGSVRNRFSLVPARHDRTSEAAASAGQLPAFTGPTWPHEWAGQDPLTPYGIKMCPIYIQWFVQYGEMEHV